MKKNIIFMGTPEFAVQVLEKLNEFFNISLVITGPDRKRNRKKLLPTPVKAKALELGLEVISPEDVNNPLVVDQIKGKKPDFILEVAYGQLIKEDLLNLMENKFLNIHPSLLPEYRGAAPIHQAILDGKEKTGVSIMLVEKGLDTGDVLLQSELEIKEEDDIYSLSEKLADLGASDAIYAIEHYDDLYINRFTQSKYYTYAKKLTKESGHIHWEDSAKNIKNQIRALKEWPGTYTFYKDTRVKIWDAQVILEESKQPPGTILQVDDEGIQVSCGKQILSITKLQFPNKKKITVKEFLLGNSMECHELFR